MGHFRKECISLLMTTRCNLACDYCYLTSCNLDEISIDLDFAKQGIVDYFAETHSRHIRFFGAGEPTLEFDKIRDIRNYAYEIAKQNLVVEIQTNGVFSEDVAKWLAVNTNIIWISHDGLPDVHDTFRKTKGGKPTSSVIERNIRIMLKENPSIQIGIRATITPLNLYRQLEMLKYFDAMGIRVMYSDPVFPPVEQDTENVKKISLEDGFMMEYAREYLFAREYAVKNELFYGSILTVNFDEKSEIFCRSCLPAPHLTPDGYVTSCDMSFSGNVLPELIYGYYDKKRNKIVYDQDKVSKIRTRRAKNLKDCAGCDVLFNCAGGCFGEGLNETGDILGIKKDYCEAIRFLAKNIPRNDQSLVPYLHP